MVFHTLQGFLYFLILFFGHVISLRGCGGSGHSLCFHPMTRVVISYVIPKSLYLRLSESGKLLHYPLLCRYLSFEVGWFVSSHVAPGMATQTKKQLNEQSVRRWRINLIEVDGVKLKCVYWITQHKDGSKGKKWDIWKTAGS